MPNATSINAPVDVLTQKCSQSQAEEIHVLLINHQPHLPRTTFQAVCALGDFTMAKVLLGSPACLMPARYTNSSVAYTAKTTAM